MLHCEMFSVLLLLGVCLCAWAAPLGSTSSPQKRRCDGTEQGSRETSEHLASHIDDKLCVMSSRQTTPSPRVKEWQEPEGISEGSESEVTGVNGHNRPTGSVQVHKGRKVYVQYQGNSKESIDDILLTSTSIVDSTDSQKRGPPGPPFEPSPGTSTEMLFTLGHSDLMKSRGLLYSSLDEDKRTILPLITAPPQEEEGKWEVETIKKNRSAELNPKGVLAKPPFMVSSSTYDSASQPPWTINPAVTSQTTSGSSDGEAGGARLAEESLFTATELQDKALVPGLLQPDLTFSSRLAELGGTWTEPVHLQGTVEEVSILPLSQEVGTEATMSSEDLPLIFDDVTPPSSSALASDLSVAMVPATGMLGEAELEQTVSVDTEHAPSDASLLGPSDWPSPWQMSGSENSDVVMPSQMPVSSPFSEGDLEHTGRTERLQNTDMNYDSRNLVSPSPVWDTTQHVTDIKPTPSTMKTGLEELESEEEEDEEDEDVDESEEEEEDSEEDPTEAPVHTPTRPPYSLIPPPPVWGQQNQGLLRSWVELIREKAGYVSGMLAPVGIGIAGALLIVGALYSIRMIHRRRKNSFKHQRRKQPREVRNGPDQAMLLADSSEDEF